MSEQEPHKTIELGTTLIPIPANVWNDFVQTCLESDDITSDDYRMFATIICIDAISGYTERKKKRNAKKAKEKKGLTSSTPCLKAGACP